METTLHISGMHCTSCEKLIRMALEEVPGVKVKAISYAKGEVRFEMKDEKGMSEIRKAIEAEGYKLL
ncbi:Heavy-metal-associated domain protein [uncultured archaeon]|nr:Heavy-metal-associated domain protein [uncultured archaeon]